MLHAPDPLIENPKSCPNGSTEGPRYRVPGAFSYQISLGDTEKFEQTRCPPKGKRIYGKAFENWIYHEMKAYLSYHDLFKDISYWSIGKKTEVDFIVGKLKLCVEAKASAKIQSDHLRGLREIKKEHPSCGPRIVVSLESVARQTEDGIRVLPFNDFCKELWAGNLFT